MKPFDLKRALAGDPVVTRLGIPVEKLTYFGVDILYPVYGVFNNRLSVWTKEGKFISPDQGILDHENDIFMASIGKYIWINIWEKANGAYLFTTNHNREDLADKEIEDELNHIHIKKIKVEI